MMDYLLDLMNEGVKINLEMVGNDYTYQNVKILAVFSDSLLIKDDENNLYALVPFSAICSVYYY